jgi:hypothetical protein
MTEVAASALGGLEPATFWAHFEALTRIPRPARHEDPAIAHVHLWAGEHDFQLEQDEGRNTAVVGVLFLPANGTQIAAAEADSTGTTTLGKRVIDHSFQLPLQIAWIVTALVGILVVAVFY